MKKVLNDLILNRKTKRNKTKQTHTHITEYKFALIYNTEKRNESDKTTMAATFTELLAGVWKWTLGAKSRSVYPPHVLPEPIV